MVEIIISVISKYIIIIVEKCRLNLKQCKKCMNFHYISYAINSGERTRTFFKNADNYKYFHISNETIFEQRLLNSLLSDILFKHSSFRSFSDSYNYQHSLAVKERFLMSPIRLADIFYSYELNKFWSENDIKEPLESKYLFYFI
jgi:hypothetical protein